MIAVIGCGNPNRSDDGVGIEVVRTLHASGAFRDRPDVKLLDAGTDGMAVMFAARGCSTLVVVDACRSGGAPGAIFEAPGDALETPAPAGLGLHELRWDHALHAGRAMYKETFPRDVTVFLVEARSVALGLELSDEVRAAAATVAERIAALVRSRPA